MASTLTGTIINSSAVTLTGRILNGKHAQTDAREGYTLGNNAPTEAAMGTGCEQEQTMVYAMLQKPPAKTLTGQILNCKDAHSANTQRQRCPLVKY